MWGVSSAERKHLAYPSTSEKRSQPQVPLSTPRNYLQSTSGVNIFVYQWKNRECRQGLGKGWERDRGKDRTSGRERQREGKTEERGNVGSTSMICQLKIFANPHSQWLFLFGSLIWMVFHPPTMCLVIIYVNFNHAKNNDNKKLVAGRHIVS